MRSALSVVAGARRPGSGLRRTLGFVLAAALGASSFGCQTVKYVSQAAKGQEDFILKAQDIDLLLAEERLPPKEKALLGQVHAIKAFGEEKGLRPTKNYQKYVRLHRNAAVWIVSASDPLRFRSRLWKFPIIGSITYVGWFDRKEADKFGDELRAQHLDVDVRPAGAYSTLGWFEDPVLSSMIPEGPEATGALADVISHESLHATYYLPGQSRLNESVANFVGQKLAQAYLIKTKGENSRELLAYQAMDRRGVERRKMFGDAYAALDALYKSNLPDEEKLAKKAEIIADLQKRSRMSRPINNATLIQSKTYNSGQEELERLLGACEGSFPRMIRTLERLKAEKLQPQESDVGKLIAQLGSDCAP